MDYDKSLCVGERINNKSWFDSWRICNRMTSIHNRISSVESMVENLLRIDLNEECVEAMRRLVSSAKCPTRTKPILVNGMRSTAFMSIIFVWLVLMRRHCVQE